MKWKNTVRIASIFIALILCASLLAPVASARGSAYIVTYGGAMTAIGAGKVTASFSITGTGVMDEIGSTKITIYEDNKLVKTYLSTDTPGLMGYNKYYHSGTVTYSGTAGKTYYANITYKAGKNGDWDNRSLDTISVVAVN